jgi:hypothetical protein
MWKDPIIEDIHKNRERYLKRFNYNIHDVCKNILGQQDQDNRKVVAPKPRPAKKVIKTA